MPRFMRHIAFLLLFNHILLGTHSGLSIKDEISMIYKVPRIPRNTHIAIHITIIAIAEPADDEFLGVYPALLSL